MVVGIESLSLLISEDATTIKQVYENKRRLYSKDYKKSDRGSLKLNLIRLFFYHTISYPSGIIKIKFDPFPIFD